MKETTGAKLHRMEKGGSPRKAKKGRLFFMDIDYGKVRGAADLPDDQFAALIYAVMVSSGASSATALAAMANAAALKKRLASAGDKELKELAESIDPAALSAVLSALKEREGQGG